jgi:hypothetical protein
MTIGGSTCGAKMGGNPGAEVASPVTGGAKKLRVIKKKVVKGIKPVKRVAKKGGEGGEHNDIAKSLGGAKKVVKRVVKRVVKKVVKKGGEGEKVAEEERKVAELMGPEYGNDDEKVSGGAKKQRPRKVVLRRVRKGGSSDEDDDNEKVSGGAKKRRRRVRKGGSSGDDDENDDEKKVSGGAKKRALTPYNKFVKKHFPKMKAEFPNNKAVQIMKKIAIEWKKQK